MAQPAVYKSKNVLVTIDGIPLEDILEDGEIQITFDRENVSKQLDLNDGGLFSYRSGFPAKVIIPVMQNSIWITTLNAAIMTGTMMSIALADANDYVGRVIFQADYCMAQMPDITFGPEAGAREYVFEVINSHLAPLP